MVFNVNEAPTLSTDQVAAFVQLAHQGSIRGAAGMLHITEQGLRNRLIALERRLGVELYRKARGIRNVTPLTTQGQQFLPHAIAFLEHAGELTRVFAADQQVQEIAIVASQYLATYVLIRGIGQFHQAHPEIRVRLSVRTESEIESMLLERPEVQLGFAAPYESSTALHYDHLFSMNWSVVTARSHTLAARKRVRLEDIAGHPLIVYERGSTGRQHVIEAFGRRGLTPKIDMEATTTDLIVRMVEADFGVSIVPLMADGTVTHGRKIFAQELGKQVRPIDSGILTRRGESLSAGAAAFVQFVRHNVLS